MKKLITAFTLLLVFAFTGCAEIDQTERGVVLNFGKVTTSLVDSKFMDKETLRRINGYLGM